MRPDMLFEDSEEHAAAMPFATADTIASCAQYLEPILRDAGLRQWQLHGGDAVAAVNRLFDLVQQFQHLQDARELEQDDLHKAKVDVKVANKTILRLQGQLDAKEQELGALNIKLRQLEAWYRDETDRWASEREELCRKCCSLEQRHTQWQHELRRRDAEFERLQKHLATQISATERRRRISSSNGSSGSTSSSSAMILTSAGAGSTKHGRGPTAAANINSSKASGSIISQLDTKRISKAELEDIFKRTVETLEAEKQGLESDNAALRKALHSLEHDHKELLNQTHTAARCSGSGSSTSEHQHQADGSSSPSPSSDTGFLLAGSGGSPPTAAADPAAALHRMHNNLQALRVRKQRVTGGRPLCELQQQAESASERLLLAKLQEAGRIMEEQESALALALKAISGTGEGK